MDKKGDFYVVSTPIGNLGDITYRAVEILKQVDLVLAEDTRVTKKLLDRYEVNTELFSYREQNHNKALPIIIQTLEQGKTIALVSDAGTPLISDPGFKLVEALLTMQIDIISIPGPSAVVSALSISGLPTDRFSFLGFLPKSKKRRKDILEESMMVDQTVVVYESPYRVHKLLAVISEIDAERVVVLANDITKMYERCWRGTVEDLLKELPSEKKLKGEFVVLIAKKDYTIAS